MPQEIPEGATPIDTDELLAAIGELYVQVRVYRRVIAQQQQQASTPPNGVVEKVSNP